MAPLRVLSAKASYPLRQYIYTCTTLSYRPLLYIHHQYLPYNNNTVNESDANKSWNEDDEMKTQNKGVIMNYPEVRSSNNWVQ